MLGTIIRSADGSGTWLLELEDGSTWTAVRGADDQYELQAQTGTEESGLHAVWTPKIGDTRRYRFSPLQSGVCWRPFVASLTCKQLKVFDSYKVRTLPSSPQISPEASPTPRDSMPMGSDAGRRRSSTPKELWSVNTSEQLNALIIVSGIWVALLEGWIKNNSSDNLFLDGGKSAEDTADASRAPPPVAGNDRASHRSKRKRVVRWFKRMRKVIWRHR